jgi:hypothetical protein
MEWNGSATLSHSKGILKSKLNSFAATQKEMESTLRTLESTRIELRDTNSIVNDLSEKLNGKILIKKRNLLKRDATK